MAIWAEQSRRHDQSDCGGELAEAAALLVSGEYQLAMGSVATIAQAVSQGLELLVVSGATVVGGPEDKSQQVLSRKRTVPLR